MLKCHPWGQLTMYVLMWVNSGFSGNIPPTKNMQVDGLGSLNYLRVKECFWCVIQALILIGVQ